MMNYYAKLNENEICTEIVSTKKDLKGIRGFVEIPDYNESLLYKKWLGDRWSHESYEPSLETQIQDDIGNLKETNKELTEKILNKDKQIADLISQQKIALMGMMEVNTRLRELERAGK